MAKLGEGDKRWIVSDRQDGRNVNNYHVSGIPSYQSTVDSSALPVCFSLSLDVDLLLWMAAHQRWPRWMCGSFCLNGSSSRTVLLLLHPDSSADKACQDTEDRSTAWLVLTPSWPFTVDGEGLPAMVPTATRRIAEWYSNARRRGGMLGKNDDA